MQKMLDQIRSCFEHHATILSKTFVHISEPIIHLSLKFALF